MPNVPLVQPFTQLLGIKILIVCCSHLLMPLHWEELLIGIMEYILDTFQKYLEQQANKRYRLD